MKRIAYLFLTLFLFIPSVVKADTFNFTQPNSACHSTNGGAVNCYSSSSGTWWDQRIYTIGNWSYYATGDTSIDTNGIAVIYDSTNLCPNSSGILTGRFYTGGSTTFFEERRQFAVWLNGRQCSTSNHGYYLDFSCSVYNDKSINLSLNSGAAQVVGVTTLGLAQVGSLTCEVGNNDIIINNNQNTQDIINNQNQNSQNIINNQNANSQNEINNDNKNQQQTNEKLDETNKELGELNDNITDSSITDASSSADSFFSGFESDDYGLSSIITAPLNLIKSITSSTCTPLGFPAPFVDQNITLPCMGAIYKEYFGSFLTIYQTITFGMVAYWVSVKIFFMVKGFKDPDNDRIEVLDL